MTMNKKKVVIMAGGTGGHIFPGLAVAKALIEKDFDLHWLGAYGLERTLVPISGIPLTSLPIQGLRGKGLIGWALLPFRLGKAVWSAIQSLREINPNCVVGFGGFASVPGGIAAWLLRIPIVIHEQNAVAGLANRLLAKVSRAVLTGFEVNIKRAQCVGNPVRAEFLAIKPYQERYKERSDTPLNILIVGGSQGAKRINQLIIRAVENVDRELNIWHQTGKQFIEEAEDLWAESGKKPYRVAPFIDDMAEAYEWADLVICRAGALTLAELMATNVASILIPFPYAVDDHQTKNAEMAVHVGAARVFKESELDLEILQNLLQTFTRNDALMMARQTERLAKPNATNDIVAVVERVIK